MLLSFNVVRNPALVWKLQMLSLGAIWIFAEESHLSNVTMI